MRRTLGGVGRLLVTVGVLILLFVAYELWGTGWFTARDQAHLKNEFRHELAAQQAPSTTTLPATSAPPVTATTTTTVSPTVTNAAIARIISRVKEGDPIGIIHMPWGDYAVVQGTSRDDLKKGPGHYLDTPYPGQYGNAAIAGHRTTYLHPFSDLDSLHPGETFTIDMLWGRYTYRVATPPVPVLPTDAYVARTGPPLHGAALDHPDSRPASQAWLTLTTCNPKFSASQRLIVQALLVVKKSPPPVKYTAPPTTAPSSIPNGGEGGTGPIAAPRASSEGLGLSGDRGARGPMVLWAAFVLVVGGLWWWVYRHWRHPATWFVGCLAFLPVLVGFYIYLERVLPAGY